MLANVLKNLNRTGARRLPTTFQQAGYSRNRLHCGSGKWKVASCCPALGTLLRSGVVGEVASERLIFLENVLLAFQRHPPTNLQSPRLTNYGEVFPDICWISICYITINYLALISGIFGQESKIPTPPSRDTRPSISLSHSLRQRHVSQTVGSISSTSLRAPHICGAASSIPHNPHNLPTPRRFPLLPSQFHPQHHPKTTSSTTRRLLRTRNSSHSRTTITPSTLDPNPSPGLSVSIHQSRFCTHGLPPPCISSCVPSR